MIEKIDEIKNRIDAEISQIKNISDLELFRIKYLSRKGIIADLYDSLKNTNLSEKPLLGKAINELRAYTQSFFDQKNEIFQRSSVPKEEFIDLTLPGKRSWVGSIHPITQTLNEIKSIFKGMGFEIASGPEIEDDFHNFEALNFPPDHPARDMQDTFFIDDKVLLRTHTSPVQIRVMKEQKPPIRVIIPGRVYRNEAISARSYCLFHQMEGLFVDEGVTFSELKGTLLAFAKQFYGSDIKYRFRPSFFPFTEPSAEMDITCFLCHGKGCRVCKYTGWLEILGCGMVDPNVYKYVNYNPKRYSGYAFGMGIERIAMLRYGVDDIRLFFNNDVRFLKQF
jgi:phenylalanyl-tRNA synthetase alpha chain